MEPATLEALRYAVRAAMPRARTDRAALVAIQSVAAGGLPSASATSSCT